MYIIFKKIGFVGFFVVSESIKGIFYDLVERDFVFLKYVLMYKFS